LFDKLYLELWVCGENFTFHEFAQVTRDDDEVFDSRFGGTVYDMVDRWLAGNGQHRLRQSMRQWPHARTFTCSGNQTFDWHMPDCYFSAALQALLRAKPLRALVDILLLFEHQVFNVGASLLFARYRLLAVLNALIERLYRQ
jgi:hypothetical protein